MTQYAGVRPFGVGFLIGGVDETGPRLFETDPSGTIIEWYAQSIGRGSDKSKKVFETGYKPKMKEEEAVKLVLNALRSGEKDIEAKDIEVSVIKLNDFRRLSEDEISRLSK